MRICPCCVRVCPSPSTRVVVHGRAFASQFMRICDFLCYICSKVSICWAGLDLVASNKRLFQCCSLQWPSPQGTMWLAARATYIWLVWVTARVLQLSDTGRQRGTSGFFWLQISFEFQENLFQGFKLKSFFFFFRTFYWFRSWCSMIAHDAPSWDSRATSSCTLCCLKSGSALSLSGPQMETITTTINL